MKNLKKIRTHAAIAITILLAAPINAGSFLQQTKSKIKQTIQQIKIAYSRRTKREKQVVKKGALFTVTVILGSSIAYLAHVIRKRTKIFPPDPIQTLPDPQPTPEAQQPQAEPASEEQRHDQTPEDCPKPRLQLWARAAAAFKEDEKRLAKTQGRKPRDPHCIHKQLSKGIERYDLNSVSEALDDLGDNFTQEHRTRILQKLISQLHENPAPLDDESVRTQICCIFWNLAIKHGKEGVISKISRHRLKKLYFAHYRDETYQDLTDLFQYIINNSKPSDD